MPVKLKTQIRPRRCAVSTEPVLFEYFSKNIFACFGTNTEVRVKHGQTSDVHN